MVNLLLFIVKNLTLYQIMILYKCKEKRNSFKNLMEAIQNVCSKRIQF